MLKLILIAIAVFAGAFVSEKIGVRTLANNRKVEWPENKKSETLSQAELHWTIVHVRDDIGSVYSVLVVTNALLAGVLVAIVTLTF
jgi:hypothetical protein